MQPVPATVPALVTGASSGLGESFARHLAGRGHELVLVARRVERLERLATELRAVSGAPVGVLGADLETAEGRGLVAARLGAGGPWLLVNSAGFGTRGRFVAQDPAREAAEITVNALAVHQLMRAALPGCLDARDGGVINVASTAAFQPLPHFATYAATKAFVLHLTEAVAAELPGSGVRVMALCPGPTRTEFGNVAGVTGEFERIGPLFMAADKVVGSALRSFDHGDVICVPGAINLAGATGVRLLPRFAVRRLLEPVFRKR
jgi:short-subunit dehydrogenase